MTTQTQQPFNVVDVAGQVSVTNSADVLTTALVSSERTSRLTDRPLGKVPAPTPASLTLLSTADEVGGIREFFGYAPSSLTGSTIPILGVDLGAPFPLNSQPGQPARDLCPRPATAGRASRKRPGDMDVRCRAGLSSCPGHL